jgi:hypothetical protein
MAVKTRRCDVCTGVYDLKTLAWMRTVKTGTHYVGCRDQERCQAAVIVQGVVRGSVAPHPVWCICVACTHEGVL